MPKLPPLNTLRKQRQQQSRKNEYPEAQRTTKEFRFDPLEPADTRDAATDKSSLPEERAKLHAE